MVIGKRRVWIFSLQWFSILLLSLSSRIFCEQQVNSTTIVNFIHFELLQVNDIAAFQKLFMAKRIEQLAAVKNIQKLDESKRKLLLDQISVKLFQVGFYIFYDARKIYARLGDVEGFYKSVLRCWL